MTKQFEKKHLKQFKNQSQSGRSMVEMLGVLAIIAVLSIGGIVGYRLAMNHYQASQIAHEMNIMRTDAQIKIAQGTEKLTLGAPYDAHKINFNNYDTAFGCKYVNEDDFISEETVSCQIANAYYIELPKIPDGVCQPLIRLINGMDNLIAFSVNDSEYEEGGTCQEGENDLYAVFSGETVSDLTHCERDDDCKELESTPICDLSRHVCVECTEEKGCEGESEYCENNVCKTCASGVWNGTSCVECIENGDCENPTPYCNPTTNTCAPCENDSQCDTAQNEHCKTSTGECVVCDENTEIWDEVLKECRLAKSCEELECDTDEFCLSSGCRNCRGEDAKSITMTEEESCKNGKYECVKISEYQAPNYDSTSPYVMSNMIMNWWSTERFCAALPGSKHMVEIKDLKCNDQSIGGTKNGYCYADSNKSNVSDTIRALRKAENGKEDQGINWYWLKDQYSTSSTTDNNSCGAYHVDLNNVGVSYDSRNGGHGHAHALCK